mmetsp:Transcript_18458/g.47452  ORF Transcript_18458/g.47452 Transcript_18458/m.47452 type:complete len:218 (-) Transcript_18458:27-680(-)
MLDVVLHGRAGVEALELRLLLVHLRHLRAVALQLLDLLQVLLLILERNRVVVHLELDFLDFLVNVGLRGEADGLFHLGEVPLQGLALGPLLANLAVDRLLLRHQHIDILGEFLALGHQLLALRVEDLRSAAALADLLGQLLLLRLQRIDVLLDLLHCGIQPRAVRTLHVRRSVLLLLISLRLGLGLGLRVGGNLGSHVAQLGGGGRMCAFAEGSTET